MIFIPKFTMMMTNICVSSAPYCACCASNCPMVNYTSYERFTPEQGIVIVDNMTINPIPLANTLRPTGSGTQLDVAFDEYPPPYVQIDLDEPNIPNSFLNVAEIELKGNVATVTVYIKTDDNAISWDKSADMTVDPITHEVDIPDNWRTGQYDTVPMGKIKIVLLNSTDPFTETYTLWVNLIGCYCETSK